jgi:hypothetical protein
VIRHSRLAADAETTFAPLKKLTKRESVSIRTDIHLRFFHDAAYGGSKAKQRASSHLGGSIMETLLIVLLVVFLLGGGGWGYSRWRRN